MCPFEIEKFDDKMLKKLASDVNLLLSEEKVLKINKSITNVLNSLVEITQVNLEDEPYFGQPLWAFRVRPDEVGAKFDTNNILRTSPQAKLPYFVVPKVL